MTVMEAVCQKAVNKFGYLSQIGMAMEECGELVTALNKFFLREISTASDLCEEIADVEIMIFQIKFILTERGYGDTIESSKNLKIDKLAKRLKL